MKIAQVKKKILQLDTKKKIKFVVLFGSMSKGRNTPLSDIDIAVYYDADKKERFDFRLKLLSELNDKIDFQIFQDLPLPVKKEVLGGQLLHYKDFQFTFDEYMKVIKEFNSFEKYYDKYINDLKRVVVSV